MAAYSYMALVPIIQPPIMRALTSVEERKIRMPQLRCVSKREKILFPLLLVPHLGLVRSGLLFGLLNVLVALWALWLDAVHGPELWCAT